LRQPDGATGTSLAQVLTGTNFGADATVAVSGGGVTVTNLAVVSSTSITAMFVVDPNAALGSRTVTVTSGGATSAGFAFSVTSPNQVVCAPATQTIAVGATASFSASGGFSSFAWSAAGGTPSTGGDRTTFSTTYAAAGTYTVSVTRGTTATCSVTVGPALPTMDTFRASPEVLSFGQSTTLTWAGIANATNCSIDHGIGAVPCRNGSVTHAPSETTVYTMTLTNAAGSRTFLYTVIVAGAAPLAGHGSQTFNFTGAQQTFVVPALVTSVTIQASGAQGGNGVQGLASLGNGGTVTATIAVTPGETLAVFVGGMGTAGTQNGGGAPAAPGGFNGGGAASAAVNVGGGGGGASDVRQGGTALANRVVVAGGGGGSGAGNSNGAGGAGGGTTGAAGATVYDSTGGAGGTQAAGGAGGNVNGSAGALGVGGASGVGGISISGGGGGGGYFGGGGGGGSASFPTSGGGGGSSFAIGTATGVTHVQGNHTGNGVVVITW